MQMVDTQIIVASFVWLQFFIEVYKAFKLGFFQY